MGDIRTNNIDTSFSSNNAVKSVQPRYQWDKGVILNVSGIKSDDTIMAHCSFEGQVSPAIIVTTSYSNDVCSVIIPDELFMQSRAIRCYLYAENEEAGVTVYEIRIPIIPRAKPGDYVYDPMDVVPNLPELLAEIENMREATSEAVDAAEYANSVSTIRVSASKPTETHVEAWIDSDSDEEFTIPEVKDDTISEKDTWSSKKIDEEISGVQDILRTKSNAITETIKGPLGTTDISSDMHLQGLRLYGKTTQYGAPTPEAPVDLVSIGNSGSITAVAVGKNMFNINDVINSTSVTYERNGDAIRMYTTGDVTYAGVRSRAITLVKDVTYTLTAKLDALVNGNPSIGFREVSTMKFVSRTTKPQVAGDIMTISYTPTETADYYIYLLLTGAESKTCDMTYSSVQLEVGNKATAYESYKLGGSVTVATPNGLPGIPVANGGNYTDASGQQWISDEIDLGRGVYVQRVKRIVVDGTGAWGIETKQNSNGDAVNRIWLRASDASLEYGRSAMQATSFIARSAVDYGLCCLSVDNYALMHLSETMKDFDRSQVQAWLAENPVTIQYIIATPVETPISADELASYTAMHSNKPNTTVYNNADVWMETDYSADVKMYIDKKLAEMTNALLSTGNNV